MKYRITVNGKPAREAPEPVSLDEMKIAVIDIQLALMGSLSFIAVSLTKGTKSGFVQSFAVHHHGGVDIIDVEEVP